ncbi:hypothetical protein H2201_000659 [Coniosporium apollinis]|uniref:Fungal N-terminal domain-containing protein n=1 Tax=Coniosporium apollinis TaxID=61459 RepID=A0ABQ9PAA9_9PEZI|nr:hypothetical protein H2201_000659 [Coniosporium apollinis]
MEPLSVIAAVAGLITAGAKISTILYEFTSSMEDAPRLARDVLTELNALTVALGHVQTYVLGAAQASPARTSLILLEHVLVTLTGCVTTYSDLEVVLKGLNMSSSLRVYDKFRWTIREKSISASFDATRQSYYGFET